MTKLITRSELEHAIAAGEATVVDALGKHYWAQQHLPGAVPLLAADAADKAAALLPDKSAAIITYCASTSCGNSQELASKLEDLGYTNVRKYREGIQGWTEAGLTVEAGAKTP